MTTCASVTLTGPIARLRCRSQAYEGARRNDESEGVQIGALLHDIGHMLGMEAGFAPGMNGCGTLLHERIGGDFLYALGFSEDCAETVRQHVNAKRYLVHKHKDYELSEASRITLGFQGGPMTAAEADQFERHPLFTAILRMRTYDEMAKREGEGNVAVSTIGGLVEAHVRKNVAAALRAVGTATAPDASLLSGVSGATYQLSAEQLRFFDENGFLLVRGHPAISRQSLEVAMRELVRAQPSAQGEVDGQRISGCVRSMHPPFRLRGRDATFPGDTPGSLCARLVEIRLFGRGTHGPPPVVCDVPLVDRCVQLLPSCKSHAVVPCSAIWRVHQERAAPCPAACCTAQMGSHLHPCGRDRGSADAS